MWQKEITRNYALVFSYYTETRALISIHYNKYKTKSLAKEESILG